MKVRTYSEMILLPTFEERYEYLKINGEVGMDTFGFRRFMNQDFYRSKEWKDIRDYIIIRDNGCDLGIEDRDIHSKIIIHHMNPISAQDILDYTEYLTNPEYLICVSHKTHNAIHYGDVSQIKTPTFEERRPNDTCPWK